MSKILVVKLGSEQNGWLPSEKHYNDIKYKLIQSGTLKKFDGYIITHFGTNFEIIDSDNMKIESPENYFEIKTKEELIKENYLPKEGDLLKNSETLIHKELEKNDIKEYVIPNILEGLNIKITKNGLLSAIDYLKKTRQNKELSEKFLIESILKLIYCFSK